MDDEVSADENLARFIFSKRHFNMTSAKWPAFMPEEGKGAISVYRIDDLAEVNIFGIGNDMGLARGRRCYARADFKARKVIEAELCIIPDPIPHPRHADITGWPSDKADQMAKAISLKNSSNLAINNEI